MSQYFKTRPNQNVRLRKWAPGRVAQLKLFLGHLEGAINNSLAAQVQQSATRFFSEFVPKVPIQDIDAEVEYREIRIKFEIPRGLKNFLFYEADFGITEILSVFERISSPIASFVLTNLIDGTTYFMRIRVVQKNGNVGLWSDTFSATTPFSQGFGLYDGTEVQHMVTRTSPFVPVFARSYNAIGGKAYYSIDFEVRTQNKRDATNNLLWTNVEFQWFLDDNQVGQNFLVSTYRTISFPSGIGNDISARTTDIGSFPSDKLILPGTLELKRTGTFVQKFTTLNTTNPHTIELKARILPESFHPSPNDWLFEASETVVTYDTNAFITLKNFNIFEIFVS